MNDRDLDTSVDWLGAALACAIMLATILFTSLAPALDSGERFERAAQAQAQVTP